MKEYTLIWIDSWMSGTNRISLTKKTWVKAPDIQTVMNSEYGEHCVYIFEGFRSTLGEEFKEGDVVELGQ